VRDRLGLLRTALLSLAVVAAGTRAFAEEPWERAIRDGIADQDAQIASSGVKRAITLLEGRASRNPDVVNLYLLSRAYGKAKEYRDAFAQYGEVLKTQPACYFAHRDLGMLHYELAKGTTPAEPGRLAQAERSLAEALRLRPGYLEALRPLAEVKLLRKDAVGAVAVLEQILDHAPKDDTARVMLVEAQLLAGRLDDALRGVSGLLQREPRNPSLRHLRGRVLLAKGEVDEATKTFRGLAEENPSVRAPLEAYLLAATKSQATTADDFLWGLERLLRLAKTPEEQKRLGSEIDRIRSASSGKPPGVPQGPPDAATQVKLLSDADARVRLAVLRWIWSPGPPGGLDPHVLRYGIVPRLDGFREPVAAHRKWALRILAKYGSQNLVAIARLSLGDPDAEVRALAADAVGELKSLAGIAALARHVEDPDPTVAVAARAWIYRLAGESPPESEETPAAQAAAFRAWWEAPARVDLKRRVVDAVLRTNDLFAEDLLVAFALEPDPSLALAAYRGLRQVAAVAKKKTPRDEWMASLPALSDEAFAGPGLKASQEALSQWWKRRPRA
jgi:tetratricopeptide (TPR) repeat protein